ncbi:hypothetical protein DHX103_06410 [Planococcus sp. X10-3]|uniref:hypothetical protein n=1 Tax=Planococcus sp. X10-3 TaxID=3061240 RepID=UPI003BB04B33
MVIEDFILSFSVFSGPKSFYDADDAHIQVSTNADVDDILGTTSNFHFNRGETNFFAQHGPAAFSFWSRSFILTDEEADRLNHNHDLALELLFEKLKAFVDSHHITFEKMEDLQEQFDCRFEILFIAPNWYGGGMLFRVKPADLLFMANLNIPFHFWERDRVQIGQLQEAVRSFTEN